jgi:phosphatidate cytidylyltransferase
MKTRVIAAAVLTPLLLIVVLFLPKVVTAILLGVICAIMAYELLHSTGLVRHTRLVLYSATLAFGVSIWSYFDMNYAWGMLGLLAYFMAVFSELMASHVKIRFDRVAVCFLAAALIPFLFCSLVRIHGVKNGRYLIMVPFVIAWLSDTGAYFAGRAFGQHKLAPVISPKKTVEGMVGGILVAMAGLVLYTLVLNLVFGFKVNYLYALVYGLLGSLGGVFGDLSFSVIKRQSGIKDYSKLIPGHGGMLDRFDSMIIVAPLTEALMMLIPLAVK